MAQQTNGVARPRTIIEKVWDTHVVAEQEGAPTLLYIDLHLVHEVTSPQAFRGLARARLESPPPGSDHRDHGPQHSHYGPLAADRGSDCCARRSTQLETNCREFGIRCFGMHSEKQGIVHVIGPELGLTQPGMTVVCGDSHTATHGAFGALAFGIGTSEVEHVLATQCLLQTQVEDLRGARGWHAEAGRFREGHHPGADRADRHRRRHGLRVRVSAARPSARSRWKSG